MSKKFIIGNLKMNGSIAFYNELFTNLKEQLRSIDPNNVDIGLCLPYPYLFLAKNSLSNTNIKWGSQNVAKDKRGAFTGEVSAEMILEFESKYVIIGHSERNTAYCESDQNIAEKFLRVKENGMYPVLCVGETLIEREAGMEKKVVRSQLETLIEKHGTNIFENSIIAYEPIWAIGSDMAASPDQAQNMCAFIKEFIGGNLGSKTGQKTLKKFIKVIYGGSVNDKNALQLLSLEDVDGALIGRCSLDAKKFSDICHSAHRN